MKRVFLLVLAAVICLTLFTGCTSGSAVSSPGSSTAAVLSGTVSTNGSTSMESVISALSEAFMNKFPKVTVTYDSTGSSAGITAAFQGLSDIGLSSRDLKSSETGLDVTTIAIDGIAVIVNKSNTLSDLSLDQIAKIAMGETENWKEIGGPDSPVVLVGREAGSGTRDGFESIVKVAGKCKYTQELTSTGAVIQAVASNPNAVGYASLASVGETVNTVKVGGVACTKENLVNGTYKIQRDFNIVTKQGAKLSPAAQAFIDYTKSSEAAPIIEKAGAFVK